MLTRSLLNAQTAAKDARIAVTRERTHLEDTLGVPADIPENSHNENDELVPIATPASGYVLEKNVTPGVTIQPSTDAFVVGDLSRLWMLASVRADQLARLHVGQSAVVSLPDAPGQTFAGKVENLGQRFDPTTRRTLDDGGRQKSGQTRPRRNRGRAFETIVGLDRPVRNKSVPGASRGETARVC